MSSHSGYVGGNKQTPSADRHARKIEITEDGMYQKGEHIYKVVRSQSSGRLYAKLLVRKPGEKMYYTYAAGEVYNLSPLDKMTAEQASAFGELYGVCCNCFRELSREESLRRGYGPTCADNEGWEYDHNAD